MSKVIEIHDLSKLYDLGLVGTGTLSKDLNRSWAKLLGKPDPYATLAELNDRTKKSSSNMVYALKDINFSVGQGEVLGIIGKNGAGKSTLLKILSQITSPSTGTIKMKGRVASLLEVGTGMHPEMTARQNIYLNGSLMGMRRHEITSKLEEIVDFAGIEKYIDTPTKRFSSGMTVRLGFAIAAFLEPEVLIVDEVLAVGDAEFQKKAIGKMKEVTSGGGRTVLFVSHDMAAITKLCENVIVMNHGNIIHQNKTEESIQFYRNQISTDVSNFDLSKRDDKKSMAYFTDFSIVNSEKISNNSLLIDESALFQFKINSKEKVNVSVRIAIFDHNEMRILAFDSRDTSLYFDLSIGENSIKCEIKRGLEIKPGKYYVNISMRSKNELLDHIVKIKVLDIEPTDYFGSGKLITSDIPLVLKKNEWSFN